MTITITDNAKEQLLPVMQSSEFKKPAIRLVITSIGCGGPRMSLALDESENAIDEKVHNNGVDVLIDKEVQLYLTEGRPIIIDYHTSKYGSGFIIDTGVSCGC